MQGIQFTCTPGNGGGLIVSSETSLGKFLILNSIDDNGNTTTSYVFKDGVYSITWYDADQQKFVSNKYIHVTKVTESAIYGNYIQDNCPQECLCAHREDLYNYITAKSVIIPAANISKIIDMNNKSNDVKEVTKVSILGISTEFIRSVIIRLRIYNDTDVDTEVTPIDMEVGKIYNVQYMDQVDHTMYEIEGKLINIAIDRHFGDEPPQTGFVRPECSNPEQVGVGGMVYYNQEHFMELPKDCPEKVVFTFDTSKYTSSTFDHVRLTDIRDVYEVKAENDESTEDSENNDGDNNHCCETCPYINSRPPMPPEGFPPAPPIYNNDIHPEDIEINELVVARCVIDYNFNGYIFFDKDNNEIGRVTFDEMVKEYSKDKY